MNNWKIVCDKVSTTMDLSEMQFEKTVATLILANLGWNEFRDNIKEQYHIEDHAKGYKPDFALFPKDKTEPGIFVELKETGHKQRAKDVKQIRTYMMLTNCRFCIYFGEKMELFYIKIDGTNRSLKSVLTLDYNPKNPDGNLLLDLINFDTYSENNLIRFCEDRLSADEAISYYTSEEGRKRLFELMAQDRHLSESAARLLSSMLTMPERKVQGVEDIPEYLEYLEMKENPDVQATIKQPKVKKMTGKKPKTAKGAGGKKKPRPPFRFSMIGLKAGDEVLFDSRGWTVKVSSDNTVECRGEHLKMSTFCKKYLPDDKRNKSEAYQGPDFFTYHGKTLAEIRDEKEGINKKGKSTQRV